MTLNEKMSQLGETDVAYIGAAKGSSYFFIGTPGDYDKYIDKIDQITVHPGKRLGPLRGRKIIQEYPHTVDVPGITILIDGRERGKFWSLHDIEKTLIKIDNGEFDEDKEGGFPW